MVSSLTLLIALWLVSYWWSGVPRLWTRQPDEWEELVATISQGGPEEWAISAPVFGRNYEHSPSGIVVRWEFFFVFPGLLAGWSFRSPSGGKLPLSRAGKLALKRAAKRSGRHYARLEAEAQRKLVAEAIIASGPKGSPMTPPSLIEGRGW